MDGERGGTPAPDRTHDLAVKLTEGFRDYLLKEVFGEGRSVMADLVGKSKSRLRLEGGSLVRRGHSTVKSTMSVLGDEQDYDLFAQIRITAEFLHPKPQKES